MTQLFKMITDAMWTALGLFVLVMILLAVTGQLSKPNFAPARHHVTAMAGYAGPMNSLNRQQREWLVAP